MLTDVVRYAATGDPQVRADLADHHILLQESLARLQALEAGGLQESAADRRLMQALVAQAPVFLDAGDAVVAARQRTGSLPYLEMAALTSAADNLGETLNSLTALESKKTATAIQTAASGLDAFGWTIGIIGVLGVMIAATLSMMLSRTVLKPLDELEAASSALAHGDMDYPVDTARKDEIGDLSRAFTTMRGHLDQMNRKLKEKLSDVAGATEEMATLGEMGSMLQSDIDSGEAYRIVADYASVLLPETSGALYVMAPSRNMLDVACRWGDAPPALDFFGPNDCWALRLGRPYSPEEERVASDCVHFDGDEPSEHLCIPLTAHGDSVGVMVLYDLVTDCALLPEDSTAVHRRNLAVSLAEQVALALSNLTLRETLREQSIKDTLTSLYNRRFMEDAVQREFARAQRQSSPMSFAMLDIDHFKDYNDRSGHAAGDAVLAVLGPYLREAVRADDIACRYGGEEFLLVFPGADLDQASQRAEQIRRGVKALEVSLEGRPLPGITVSMGVAQVAEGDASAEAALAAADRALYVAKSTGRDSVCAAGEEAQVPEDAQGATGYVDPAEAAGHVSSAA